MSPSLVETPYFAPESWVGTLQDEFGLILLRSHCRQDDWSRYSFLGVNPVLVFRSRGFCCELVRGKHIHFSYGSPWVLINELCNRFELLQAAEFPFPSGGAFGFLGYDLKHFLEPKLSRISVNDLDPWECWIGFYSSLLVFDHCMRRSWIIATGLDAEGSQWLSLMNDQTNFWRSRLPLARRIEINRLSGRCLGQSFILPGLAEIGTEEKIAANQRISDPVSNLSANRYKALVERALAYIHTGDLYQVNLSHRLSSEEPVHPWALYNALQQTSPAPFSGYLDGGDLVLASTSPELFLRMDHRNIITRPIKGTRPRGLDRSSDAGLALDLRKSAKENAELVMITDLLRNDLGRVCEFGSIQVTDLCRLESFPQVHHLVSTIHGRLHAFVSHVDALAHCFPGGSITGAPKFRAMEIIEELEPITRGPYTGCLGYFGYNGLSQWNILIRTAICRGGQAWFHVGAGIVADSDPDAEYQETLQKAQGFLDALNLMKGRQFRQSDWVA